MKRSLIILMVCVLVIGGIGAALATGMIFDNVGALSQVEHSVPPGVTAADIICNPDVEQKVESVDINFTDDLEAGSQIHAALRDDANNVLDWGATGEDGLPADLTGGIYFTLAMNGPRVLLSSVNQSNTIVTAVPNIPLP